MPGGGLTVGAVSFGPWPGSKDTGGGVTVGESGALVKLRRLRQLLDHAGERDPKELLAEIRRIVTG